MPRKQLALQFRPSHGGARKGAGRKPIGKKSGVAHRARPQLTGQKPLHLTLKVRSDVRALRTKRSYRVIRNALRLGADRFGLRVLQYSIQGNHIHLIAEADSAEALASGMKGLKVRIAKGLNRVRQRKGSVFADRYHAHVLRTPRETRNALHYVLCNAHHHSRRPAKRRRGAVEVDVLSSALTFDGWTRPVCGSLDAELFPPELPAPKSWLMRVGWRRAGCLDPARAPGGS